jgi:hypothetical protein
VRTLLATMVAGLLVVSAVAAEEPISVPDPGKFAADTMQSLSAKGTQNAPATIVTAIGRSSALEAFRSSLAPLDGKKYDFMQKVYEKDYDGALRQIVYYAHVEDIGFVYFRYNFKMTGAGWRLVNFTFKEETNELFPKDFIDR